MAGHEPAALGLSEYERDYAGYFAVAIVYYALISFCSRCCFFSLPRWASCWARPISWRRHWSSNCSTTSTQTSDRSFDRRLNSRWAGCSSSPAAASVVSVGTLLLAASVMFRHLRMTFRAIWKRTPPLIAGRIGLTFALRLLERVLAFAIVLEAATLLVVVVGLMVVVRLVSGAILWIVPLFFAVLTIPLIFALLCQVPPRPTAAEARLARLGTLRGGLAARGRDSRILRQLSGQEPRHLRRAWGNAGGLMLWMKIMSQVLFLGAELCRRSTRS